MYSVYTIALENEKYFLINTCSNPQANTEYPCIYLPDFSMDEVIEFFLNFDNEWLQLHKPLYVVSKLYGDDEELHRQLIYWIRKKGIENVRGGMASSVVLDEDIIQTLLSEKY